MRRPSLTKKGYRELVITGIEIASYGVDLPGKPDLADVVCAIAAAAPHMRLRLGSIEPSVITEDFCKKIAACGSVCRHFHLSLQSGCDATLKAMNRKYDTARFYEAMQLLRRYFPDCGMTCDVIVGFPGETEEHQLETLDFLKKRSFPTRTFSRTRAAPALRRIRWTARSTARQRQSAQSRRVPSSPKRAAGFLRA